MNDLRATKGFKILYLNVRSLLRHIEEIQADFLNGCADIFAVGETWLHANIDDSLIQSDGYNFIRLDRQTKRPSGTIKAGGGVGVYLKSSYEAQKYENLQISDENLELLPLTIRAGKRKSINLFVVYRPPTGDLNKAINYIKKTIDDVKTLSNGETLVIGDFNVDFAQGGAHVKKVKKSMDARLLKQVITDVTIE